MNDIKKIRLYDFKDTDQMVFSTLLLLLSNKTSQYWEITDSGNGDIVVVDFDTSGGQYTAGALEKIGVKVVRFGSTAESKKSALWLNKPLRATDVLRCLNNISETEFGHKKNISSLNNAKTKCIEGTASHENIPAHRLEAGKRNTSLMEKLRLKLRAKT